MADKDIVETGNGTPERVALDLMKYIDRRLLEETGQNFKSEEILTLYARCRRTVKTGSAD